MYQRVQHGNLFFEHLIVERFPIVTAAITCIAFAAEIAIKALIVHSANGSLSAIPKEHDLDKLFKSVPENLQEAIANVLNKSLHDVQKNLQKNAKAFEKWRYCYENEACGDEQFLREFVKSFPRTVGHSHRARSSRCLSSVSLIWLWICQWAKVIWGERWIAVISM